MYDFFFFVKLIGLMDLVGPAKKNDFATALVFVVVCGNEAVQTMWKKYVLTR